MTQPIEHFDKIKGIRITKGGQDYYGDVPVHSSVKGAFYAGVTLPGQPPAPVAEPRPTPAEYARAQTTKDLHSRAIRALDAETKYPGGRHA